jgi:biotin synthase
MDYAKACMDEHPSKVKRDERISREEIRKLYDLPLMDLVYRAASVHREHWDPNGVQMSTLVSIKTGACVEDCSYCTQSSRYETETKYEPLMQVQEVMKQAHAAKASGSNRLCMGAAWREVKDGPQFDAVLEMVKGVKSLGMEACVTLGMLKEHQAAKLKEAGLDYYNHNLDTSPENYANVISTRTFQDRLDTLEAVRKAGVHVCSGGILGMGEGREDRVGLLHELANLPEQPGSVPINKLMRMPGTPMADAEPIDDIEFVRTVAVARLIMPKARVRLSAGRVDMNPSMQALCFMAGANSMFAGDKLLTAANPGQDADMAMLKSFGMNVEVKPYQDEH